MATASAAAPLRALIRKTETGHADAKAYETIIHHRQGDLARPITEMTIDELLKEQLRWVRSWKLPSGAAGAYQIIRKTLIGLKKRLGLTGSENFTPEMQDRFCDELLLLRGLENFLAGRTSQKAFGNELAKEWASFGVFSAIKGARGKMLKIGQSYYEDDGINKALVSPAVIAKALAAVKLLAAGQDVPAVEIDEPAFPQLGARDDEQVAQVQRRLKELGYAEIGNIDGDFGEFTEKAILLFRHNAGLPLIAEIDEALIVALTKAKPRPVPVARENASPAEVREKVPEAKDSWWSKVLAFWGTISAGAVALVNFIISNITEAKSAVKPITDLIGSVPLWAWALLLGGGLLTIWLKSRGSEAKAVEAYQEGARR